MAAHGQQSMARISPSSITGTSDRNHVRGIVLTSRTSCANNPPSTTTQGVIVGTAETARTGGNKKTIEAPPSFTRKGYYATSSGASPEQPASARSTNADEAVRSRNGNVQKTCSHDSIIVQVQQIRTPLDALERSPSASSDELVSSVYSQSSAATVIKRTDRNSAIIVDNQSNMNDLPSYELASAYVKTNAYAQMSNSKGATNSTSNPAVSAAGSATNMVTTHQPHSITHSSHSYDKISQQDQSPSTPTAKMVTSSASSSLLTQQQRQSHLVRDSSLEPIGEEERLVQMTQAVMNSQPSRSKRAEVLRYFSAAKAFQVRVVGGDMQITDADGCPLFDAYQELDCRQRWWNIEAYGDRVLLMREELAFGDGSSSWGSRVTITDWNGEVFGYLITGDPLRLESAERVGIGRFSSQPAIVNNAACSNATSMPKACWLCQAANEDGREQTVARLEAYQRLVFLGDVHAINSSQQLQSLNFHLKLMILAGVVRLVGALTVTPVSDCLALTKFFCNCCSYK